jgi:restriction system protein
MEEDVGRAMKLPEDLLSVLHGDGPKSQFEYELSWVRTHLKKVGALENSERGVWRLTPTGAAMTEAEIRDVPKRVAKLQKQKPKAVEGDDLGEKTEEELAWKDKLLEILKAMKPDAFERLSQRILRESGFTKVAVTGRSGDGGIDGAGVLRVNLLSFHVRFQCKRYDTTVGPSVVRDFRGAMVGRADKGLIITTGSFTADARREAVRDGAPAIDLVDGETLCDLLKQYKIGVNVRLVEDVAIDKTTFEAI